MLTRIFEIIFGENLRRRNSQQLDEERQLRLTVESFLAQKNQENLQFLKTYIDDIARRKWAPWTIGFMLLSLFLGLAQFLDFFGANEKLIDRATENYVTNHLREPVIRRVMEDTMNQSKGFAQEQLKPLESELAGIKAEISNRQRTLGLAQEELARWQEIQRRYVGARGGAWSDYEWLKTISLGTNDLAELARGAVIDVETFYDSYRFREGLTPGFASNKGQPVSLSLEEVVANLSNTFWRRRETAAIQLRLRNKKSVLGELVKQTMTETNLYVLSHCTRTFITLSGSGYIPPLDKGAMENWWKTNTTLGFVAPYADFAPWGKLYFVGPESIDSVSEACEKLIEVEPEAVKARCIRAFCSARRGKLLEAESALASLEAEVPHYAFFWYVRAYVFSIQGKHHNAARAAEKAIELNSDMIQIREVIKENGTLTNPELGIAQ